MLAGVNGSLYCWTRSQDWALTGLHGSILGLHGSISDVRFHPGGRTLVYAASVTRFLAERPPLLERVRTIQLYPLTATRQFDQDQLQIVSDSPAVSATLWVQRIAFTPDARTLLANRFELRGIWSTQTSILSWHFNPSGAQWQVANAVPGRTVADKGAALVGDTWLALAGPWGIELCPLEPSTLPLAVPGTSKAKLVVASPRGELVAAAYERHFRLWHLRREQSVVSWQVPPQSVSALAFSPDGRTLAIGDSARTVTFHDALTGTRGSAYDFGVGPIQSLAYAPDGLTLAIAGSNGLVVIDVE